MDVVLFWIMLFMWVVFAWLFVYTVVNHFLNYDPFSIPKWEDRYSSIWFIINFCVLVGWGVAG